MNAKGAQVNHQLLNLSSRGSAVAHANDPCRFKPRSSRIMFLGLLIISLFLCQSAYSAPQDFHYNGRYYLFEWGSTARDIRSLEVYWSRNPSIWKSLLSSGECQQCLYPEYPVRRWRCRSLGCTRGVRELSRGSVCFLPNTIYF